jgi:hypothetical protein
VIQASDEQYIRPECGLEILFVQVSYLNLNHILKKIRFNSETLEFTFDNLFFCFVAVLCIGWNVVYEK